MPEEIKKEKKKLKDTRKHLSDKLIRGLKVPSALKGLTSEFGMGSGITPSQ